MEYEFRRDLLGHVEARFSMSHEAMGSWLMAEVHSTPGLPDKLQHIITVLQAGERWDYVLEGQEFDLKLTRTEASVRSTTLPDQDDEDELMDDLSFYDQELVAECGLDDFKTMLDAWQQFVL